MRADQPVAWAAAPTVSPSIGQTLTQACQGLRGGGSLPPVCVLEPDDVVDLRRRDLEDRRVLECPDAVYGARGDPEGGARRHHLSRGRLLPRSSHLDLCSPLEHVPRLVLLPVELHRESLSGADEEQLAAVVIGERPDQ